jgi:hypothetical protein
VKLPLLFGHIEAFSGGVPDGADDDLLVGRLVEDQVRIRRNRHSADGRITVGVPIIGYCKSRLITA